MKTVWLLVALLCLGIAGKPVAAHELRPGFLELVETAPNTFDVLWKVPARGEARLALDARLPKKLR
jgi:hypothetical protein